MKPDSIFLQNTVNEFIENFCFLKETFVHPDNFLIQLIYNPQFPGPLNSRTMLSSHLLSLSQSLGFAMRIPLESRHSDAHIGHSKNGFPLSQRQAPLDLYLHSKVDSRVATVHSTRIMMVQLILKHLVIINLAISSVVFAEAYHSPSANSSQPSQKATRPIAESSFSSFGVQFNCSKDQIQKLEKEFNQLFSSYGWLGDPSLASLKTSTEGTQLNIHLNTPLTDTDTLTLHNRAEFKINPDIDRFVDRSGKKHDYKIADEKEIVASMLQRGRLFEFEKSFCSFEKFLEHIKIRQNIIRWGIRALWKFPEDGSKTNTKLWASDWKLQPG
ncbi:MAG: hypothetical protein ACKOA8_19915, partial [Deltaproteobacteria bacterium]